MKPETKQIGVRFPLTLLAEIELIAEREHRAIANVVMLLCREALDQRLKAEESKSVRQ